jgi:hypothetical protein
VDNVQTSGSIFLIGAALALAGIVGVVQPPGHRGGVVLALLAGAGVGIAGLALGWSSVESGSEVEFWRVFFISSIAGFVTVAATLALAWYRARPRSNALP